MHFQLHDASEAGDLVKLRGLLSRKDESGRPAVKDNDIHAALEAAAREGRGKACRLLGGKVSLCGKLKYFFQPTLDVEGLGALHNAVIWLRFKIVQLFIQEFKWNINKKNRYGLTPLFYAICHPHTQMSIQREMMTLLNMLYNPTTLPWSNYCSSIMPTLIAAGDQTAWETPIINAISATLTVPF
jgi:Ankyrin repeats (many copies)